MSFPALPLIGLGLTAGSSFLTAGAQAQAANAQAQVANDQLKIDMENERIKGMQEASARQEEYLRNESANRVAAAALGGGINISYDQGIQPYNKKVMQRDLQTMGFNNEQTRLRMVHQIRVNKWNAKSQARAGFISAAADTVSAVGGYVSSGAPGLIRSRSPSQ